MTMGEMPKDKEQIDQINEQIKALQAQRARLKKSPGASARAHACRVADVIRDLECRRRYYERSIARHKEGGDRT